MTLASTDCHLHRAAASGACLCSWGARTVYIGPALGLSPHRNAVAVLALGLDASFAVAADPAAPAAGYRACRSALIFPSTLHHLQDTRGRMAFLYHDDFTLHYFGRNALSGEHPGKPRAIAVLREVAKRTGWRVLEIKRMLAGRDGAALVARISYRRGESRVERDRVLIFAVADGLLRECWAYDQDQQLMDELIGIA